MRGLETILGQLRFSMQANNCPITDFTPQGSAYTLLRSIAGAIQTTELNYYDPLIEAADFTKATGAALESFAALFGLTRQFKSNASGWILVVSKNEGKLSNSTVFTNPNTNIQYLINSSSNIFLSPYIETAVPVYASTSGTGRGLLAGTKLFSQNEEILDITVGFERKFDGSACGNIDDGQTEESDSALRDRMYSVCRAGGLLNKQSLKALLIQHPLVEDALVVTKSAGILQVFIKSNTSTPDNLQLELVNQIQNYLLGVAIKVEVMSPTPISVDLNIRPLELTDLNELKLKLRTTVENYILTVRDTKYFDPEDLISLISSYVTDVNVIQPTSTLEWDSPVFLLLGDLNVNITI